MLIFAKIFKNFFPVTSPGRNVIKLYVYVIYWLFGPCQSDMVHGNVLAVDECSLLSLFVYYPYGEGAINSLLKYYVNG